MNELHLGYDVFLSHASPQKPWVRDLAARLGDVDWNGRVLRPWLDESILEPGALSSDAELTTALDRSVAMVVVLTPDALVSHWVPWEIEHFAQTRGRDAIVPLILQPCDIPPLLQGLDPIDFTDDSGFSSAFKALLDRLLPPERRRLFVPADELDPSRQAVEVAAKGTAYFNRPEDACDQLDEVLASFDIDDPAEEGLVLSAFDALADWLIDAHANGSGDSYALKMFLGECLAAAIQRSPRARQIIPRWMQAEDRIRPDALLDFAIVRAFSKLAEFAPNLIDTSALYRIALLFDESPVRGRSLIISRVASKMRGTPLGDLFLRGLCDAGGISRQTAALSIASSDENAEPAFALSALHAAYDQAGPAYNGMLAPPDRRLQALLSELAATPDPDVQNALRSAKGSLENYFQITDIPYGYTWLKLRRFAAPDTREGGPMLGTALCATTANMEEAALSAVPSHIAVLTERRVVDALFDACGGVLIPQQAPDTALCQRLRARRQPFAMIGADLMAAIDDGDQVLINDTRTYVLKERR